ncbi:MAG TPA: shikimate dehydrogenase [Burkholderiaceae bacterium]|nr:shikimate dehydrogenase [Burkholderiaceae bacterium]
MPTTCSSADAPKAARKLLIGLIGAGIQHSLSPAMHEREAHQQGLRLHYQLIDVDRAADGAAALPRLIDAARTIGFAGLNITYPCKQAVIPLLDGLSDEATAMGAVNTVVFDGARAIGHNTDGSGWAWGFRRTLPEADLSRVVLLGAGGAGSAIAHAALRLGAGRLTIVDADAARSVALADDLNQRYGGDRARGGFGAEAALADATGLIHATPTGMAKLPGLPLSEALLRGDLWVSEIVYFPLETALLAAARRAGCAVCDGGTMAVGQAVGAFRLFTGLEPDAERMRGHFIELITPAATAPPL